MGGQGEFQWGWRTGLKGTVPWEDSFLTQSCPVCLGESFIDTGPHTHTANCELKRLMTDLPDLRVGVFRPL